MSGTNFTSVILAAGKGTRMKSQLPKVLHQIGNLPMLGHVLKLVEGLGDSAPIVVVNKESEEIGETACAIAEGAGLVIQDPQLGTGHAVLSALGEIEKRSGDVLVLFGDTPLLRPENLEAVLDARSNGADVVVVGFRPEDPSAYGRLITSGDELTAIVEAKEATPEELAVDLCNSGVMLIAQAHVASLLQAIDNKNAKGEYYLTDVVAIARENGLRCVAVEAEEEDVLGVNSRVDLAGAETIFQTRMRLWAMENGATLLDPSSTYFSFDTELGRDVIVGPNVFFGPGVRVGDDVEIKPFSHLEGAHVSDAVTMGPYARLRPEAKIGKGAKIGNFVEIKKADIGEGAKVPHLSYVGDAIVGARSNIGAGTITCNYDGYLKHLTDIGEEVFVGSNSSIIAPVKIGDGANVAAGSVISKEVPKDALAVTRADQRVIEGWALKYRARKAKEKAGRK